MIGSGVFLRLTPRSFRTRRYIRALEVGDLKSAERLLKIGVHLQFVLRLTLLAGSSALLQRLIFSGVNLRDPDQENPFVVVLSSVRDRTEKLQLLLHSGADINGTTGRKKIKLLNWAILQRDADFFDFLVRAGADVCTADRTGLAPIAAARMLEESGFEKRLISAGAGDSISDGIAAENILEHLVINENLLLSELHQLIKWCVRNSGFRLTRVTLPREQTLLYRIQAHEVTLQIELALLPDQQITLFALKEGETTPFSTLLPFAAQLDSKTLRGHVVTVLKEMEGAIRSGTFKAEQAKISMPQSPEMEKAFKSLGLTHSATQREIIAAYRTLAKRYHPDLAKSGDQDLSHKKMSEINRAYEALRK